MASTFDELQEYVTYVLEHKTSYSKGLRRMGSFERAEEVSKLIKAAVFSPDYDPLSPDPKLHRAYKALSFAHERFSDFEYKLIALCHGRALDGWLRSVSMAAPYFEIDHDELHRVTSTHVTPVRELLDSYLQTGRYSFATELVQQLQNLPLISTDKHVRIARTTLDELVEAVWVQALVEERGV
jgi:hypothetical protein